MTLHLLACAWLAMGGCAKKAPTEATPPDATPSQTTPTEAAPSSSVVRTPYAPPGALPPNPACAGIDAGEILTLSSDAPQDGPGNLQATLTQHGTDEPVHVQFALDALTTTSIAKPDQWGQWQPVFQHCWRVTEAGADSVQIEVATVEPR